MGRWPPPPHGRFDNCKDKQLILCGEVGWFADSYAGVHHVSILGGNAVIPGMFVSAKFLDSASRLEISCSEDEPRVYDSGVKSMEGNFRRRLRSRGATQKLFSSYPMNCKADKLEGSLGSVSSRDPTFCRG